jgi:hypothetical protein
MPASIAQLKMFLHRFYTFELPALAVFVCVDLDRAADGFQLFGAIDGVIKRRVVS